MARRIYRVCRARYARLDGAGAKRVGGRWNSPGRAVVYMVESIALAVLENLVHLSRQDFPTGYVCVAADLPDGLPILSERDLRRQYELGELNSRALGGWWIDSQASAVLMVLPTMVGGECNYLLNPGHRDFSKIAIEPPALFHFDPRLFG